VLDTLLYLRRETNVWFEVTTLLIPGENDTHEELDKATDWFAANLDRRCRGIFPRSIPTSRCSTPPERRPPPHAGTGDRAIQRLKHVYTATFATVKAEHVVPVLRRTAHRAQRVRTERVHLDGNHCKACGCEIAGRFERQPGNWARTASRCAWTDTGTVAFRPPRLRQGSDAARQDSVATP